VKAQLKKRLNLYLPKDASNILSSVPNRSEYIGKVVKNNNSLWRTALRYLVSNGANKDHIALVCDALSGLPPTINSFGGSVYDLLASYQGNLGKDKGWERFVYKVKSDPKLSLACAIVATEFWLDNNSLCNAISMVKSDA
jgi:hypothetical protein